MTDSTLSLALRALIDLTTGYISFASGGLAAQPYTVLEIRRSNGDVLYERDKDTGVGPHRVFPEETVAELNTMLNAVVKQGTGKRADLRPNRGKIPWWLLSFDRRLPDSRFVDYLAAFRLRQPGATVAQRLADQPPVAAQPRQPAQMRSSSGRSPGE
jgi:hypothetical protein